jgi:hypothetical protein
MYQIAVLMNCIDGRKYSLPEAGDKDDSGTGFTLNAGVALTNPSR